MAYGQIDPARLDGDALTSWYLRSPADIEADRQAAFAQRYNDFFGDAGQSSGENAGASLDQTSPAPASISTGAGTAGDGGGLDDGIYRPSQDDVQMVPTASAAWSCPTCHQDIPLPPQWQPLRPLLRAIPGLPPSGAPDDRKQCDIQDKNDRRICGQQPFPQDRAICHASASVRWKNCLRTGDVGDPPLDTAKRLRGR